MPVVVWLSDHSVVHINQVSLRQVWLLPKWVTDLLVYATSFPSLSWSVWRFSVCMQCTSWYCCDQSNTCLELTYQDDNL